MRKLILCLGLIGIASSPLAGSAPTSLPRALKAQEELVAENSVNAKAYNDYGNLLLLAGRADAAMAAYRRAVDLDSDLLSARYNLALLLERENDLRGAVEQLTDIVERSPGRAWAHAHYQLGRIAERRGRRRAAINHYATAFRLDPRLSFPDVNPSVIDSDLVTEALLQIPDGIRVPVESPRIYEEPGRIADLLLSRLSEKEESEREEPDSPDSQSPPNESVASAKSGAGKAEPQKKPSSEKVLQLKDLDPDSKVGQATPAFVPHERPWDQRLRVLQQRDRTPQRAPSGETGPSSRSTGQSRLRVRDDG